MSFIKVLQFIIAISLILAVLLQNKGTGLGSAFGGSSNIYMTKRGLDKVLFTITIILACLFFIISILNFIL